MPKSMRCNWMMQRILATPPWASMSSIRDLYRIAKDMTQATGIPHVVDHIIPLNHPRVCGLHVDWNLQVVTQRANDAKSNYFCPEQTEMFTEPEQFELPV